MLGVGVSVPQRPLVLEVAFGDGLLVAVLPVVVLESVEVVVLAELRHVVGRGVEEVGLVGGVVCQAIGGGGLEVGEVAPAREARPAGGGIEGGLRVRAVSAGRGDEVSPVVLARRRVGPGGLAVRHGGVARVDFDAEVADGEVDGSLGRGFGRDRRLLTRFVRGLVRVGAGDVRRASGGCRGAARQGQSGGDDREIPVEITRALAASPALRGKRDLIEEFYRRVSLNGDVPTEFESFIAAKRDSELDAIIEAERLGEGARDFAYDSLREGYVPDEGTGLSSILPPARRFGGGGSREAIRSRVLDALRTWVERFSGLGGL